MSNLKWQKLTSLNQQGERDTETWIRKEGGQVESYDLDLYMGKKTDLLGLKKNMVSTSPARVITSRSLLTKRHGSS